MNTLPHVKSIKDIRDVLAVFPEGSSDAAQKTAAREPTLTKPEGSLGRLEEISQWVATWQNSYPPRVKAVHCNVYAGNHGVVAQGISAFPSAVTQQMVKNFIDGGAAVNQMCATFDVDLQVHEMALDQPTEDFSQRPAMSDEDMAEAFFYGMTTVKDHIDLLCLGEMGIGNTTSAAAIAHALYGGTAEGWVGRGTGVDDETLGKKIAVVGDSVLLHKEAMTDGLEVLRCLGGRELVAIAGAVACARLKRVPVLLDGYVCTAAAATLEATQPGSLDHCLVAHNSVEPGHQALCDKIGQKPLFDMNMRLGEASGAVLAVGMVRSAVSCHNNMATFADAGVAPKGA